MLISVVVCTRHCGRRIGEFLDSAVALATGADAIVRNRLRPLTPRNKRLFGAQASSRKALA